jgi:hypothetical protein
LLGPPSILKLLEFPVEKLFIFPARVRAAGSSGIDGKVDPALIFTL